MQPQSRPEMSFVPKNLHQLVGLAAGSLMPTAVQKNSFIVNEVPREFRVTTNEKILATIMNSLLTTIVSHSKHNCIRIKAKEYDDILFLSIKDNSSFDHYADNSNLREAQLLAKQMNGNLSIENTQDKFTTILLSFPNLPKAA